MLDPYRNIQADKEDALRYMYEYVDSGPSKLLTRRAKLPLKEILTYDDFSAWAMIRPGELNKLSKSKMFERLQKSLGIGFATRAKQWLSGDGIPAIILIDDSEHGTAIADGRGRVELAVGLNIVELPVLLMES